MKKIIYVILISFISSLTMTSCTENGDDPAPVPPPCNGGGGCSDPK